MKHNPTTRSLFCVIVAIIFGHASLFAQAAAPASPGWKDDGTVVRLVTSTDKVGIGTSTPTQALDVIGSIHSSVSLKTGLAEIMGQDWLLSLGKNINFVKGGDTTASIFYDPDPLSPGLKFGIQPGPIQSPSLVLLDNGNVCIGVRPQPKIIDAALSVSGSNDIPLLLLNHAGSSGNPTMNFSQDDETKFSIFYDQDPTSPGLKFEKSPGPSQSPSLVLGDDGSVSVGKSPGPLQSPTLFVGSDGSVSVGKQPGPPNAKFEIEGTGDLPLLMLNHTGTSVNPVLSFQQDGVTTFSFDSDQDGLGAVWESSGNIDLNCDGVQIQTSGDAPLLTLDHTGTTGNPTMIFQQDSTPRFSILYDQDPTSPGLKFEKNPGPQQSPSLVLGDDGSVAIGKSPGPINSPSLVVAADGSVLVGKQPGPTQDSKLSVEGTGELPLVMLNHTGATGVPAVEFSQDGVLLATISASGPHPHPWLQVSTDVRPATDLAGSLGSSDQRWTEVWAENGMIQTSDAREKENVQDMAYGLNEVLQMHPVSYTWKGRPEEGVKLGLIAQEVQPIVKEVVVNEETRTTREGKIETASIDRLGMNYSGLIPVLIKAIQEQQGMIERIGGSGTSVVAVASTKTSNPSGIPGTSVAPTKTVDPDVEVLQKLVSDQQKTIAQQNELLAGILQTLEENGMPLKKVKARADEGADGVETLQKSGASAITGALPETYSLSVNYPNPFNPTTTVQYAIPQAGQVTIEVYNMLGQKVRTLVSEFQNAGYHSVLWDGKNQTRETVSSGTYLYKMQSGSFVQTQKMVMAK